MSVVFAPAGKCIYCDKFGTTHKAELTLEHIVPFALGGDLELPAASCKACATITGAKVEQSVIKSSFAKLRYRFRVQSRRMKDRPTHVPILVGDDPNRQTKELPIMELPFLSWALPDFGLPGFLLQVNPATRPEPQLRVMFSKADAEAILAHSDGVEPVEINVGAFHRRNFPRMIAKVAHSYAYALLRETFDPWLLPLILEGIEYPAHLVGNEEYNAETTTAEDTLWSVSLRIAENWRLGGPVIVARIRFFGFLATPVYLAVVGRPRPGFKFPADSAHEKAVKVHFTGT